MSEPKPNAPRAMPLALKSALDTGPLIVFFVVYVLVKHLAGKSADESLPPDMLWATAVFMAATFLSLGISYALERKIHPLPLVTGVVIFIFGGLTLALHDKTFLKVKPTILYSIFAAILFGGLLFRKLYIRYLLGGLLELTDEGWRALTIRWGCFFVFAAILNEIVRRNFSDDVWVAFKVWGIIALTVAFSFWQSLFVTRYQIKPDEPPQGEP